MAEGHAKRIDLERNLRYRLVMEAAICEVSTILIGAVKPDLPEVLAILGRAVGVHRCMLLLLTEASPTMQQVFEWCAAGTEPRGELLAPFDPSVFPWWMDKVCRNEPVVVWDTAKLPHQASAMRKAWEENGVVASLTLPMFSGNDLLGCVGFEDSEKPRQWLREDIQLLRAASDMLAAYFKRYEGEMRRVQVEEHLKRAVSKALSGDLPICSHCKRIRDTKGHWIPFEIYLQNRTDAALTQELCPYCREDYFSMLSGGQY